MRDYRRVDDMAIRTYEKAILVSQVPNVGSVAAQDQVLLNGQVIFELEKAEQTTLCSVSRSRDGQDRDQATAGLWQTRGGDLKR